MKLEFSANLEGLAFPDGEELRVPVATEFGTLSTVMSTPERGALSIVVAVDAVPDIEDATIAERCLQVVSALVDRLAVLCDVGLGSVEEKPTATRQIPPSRPTSTTVVHDGALVIVGARDTLRAEVGPLTRAELRRVLVFGAGRGRETARQLAEPLPGDPLFRSMYREVLRGRDVLVRFVMLYAVLDAIVGADGARGKGGPQKHVDKWIRSVEPDVPASLTRPLPGGRFGAETVYTRVRNDIVHGAERKATPDAVRDLALRHGRNLQRLVKDAVLTRTPVKRVLDE